LHGLVGDEKPGKANKGTETACDTKGSTSSNLEQDGTSYECTEEERTSSHNLVVPGRDTLPDFEEAGVRHQLDPDGGQHD